MAADLDSLSGTLDSIEARVRECRAAIQVAGDGDPEALNQLGEEVDAMARDVAELKAAVSGPGLAG